MIDREAAVEIARARAHEKGWVFAEPIAVIHRRDWFGPGQRFEVTANADKFGAKARFVIDVVTGEILEEGYVPR
jgi:hypothetical protein